MTDSVPKGNEGQTEKKGCYAMEEGAVAGQTVALCVRERRAWRGGVVPVLCWERGDLGQPWVRTGLLCFSPSALYLSHMEEVGQLLGPRYGYI